MSRLNRVSLVVVLSSLACGLAEPPMEPRVRRALSIDLMSGDVTEDLDFGARGDFTVERFASSQSLAWEEAEAEVPSEQRARELWEAMRMLFEGDPDVKLPEAVAYADAVVDGQPGTSFAAELPVGLVLLVTTWDCPGAGVHVSLTTTGPGTSARDRHQRSLASARCGTRPLTVDAASIAWTFTDPDGQWVRDEEDDESDGATWRHRQGGAFLSVSAMDDLDSSDQPNLCVGSLRLGHDRMTEVFAFDEAASVYRRTSDGCVHEWAATVRADGRQARGRNAYHACGERGYLENCVVFDPDRSLDAVCDGHLACRAAGVAPGPPAP